MTVAARVAPRLLSFVLAPVLISACGADTAPVAEPDPVPLVVLDTDLGPDIDDALALAMVHHLDDAGAIELAAVTISRTSEQAVRYARVVNTIEGRPDLPVGLDPRSPYEFDDALSYVSEADDLLSGVVEAELENGATVLRRVLARAVDEDRPVVLIQVGFSGNLAALLDTDPDEASPLPGTELVAAADATLSIMAGSFRSEPAVEFNIDRDVESARRLIGGWPGDLVLSPFELGNSLHVPYVAIRDGLDPDRWVRRAYEFRDLGWHVDAPPFYDMRSWDLTSVLAGIEPDRDHFPISPLGTVVVDVDGATTFEPGEGRHRVLLVDDLEPGQGSAAIDRMVELVLGP